MHFTPSPPPLGDARCQIRLMGELVPTYSVVHLGPGSCVEDEKQATRMNLFGNVNVSSKIIPCSKMQVWVLQVRSGVAEQKSLHPIN